MIWLYYGTGGSGKSLDMAGDIMQRIRRMHSNVIANFPVNTDLLYGAYTDKKTGQKMYRKHGLFYYFDNDFLTVNLLIQYARKFHHLGTPQFKEGQTLLCIDECQFFFDPRDSKRKDRRTWLKFFTQHRKLGFNVILTTPSPTLIDRQILGCVEYTVRHRKVNNAGLIGHLIPFKAFAAITRWNGVPGREGIVEKRFFRFHNKFQDLYDSYRFFSEGKDAPKDGNYNIRQIRKVEQTDYIEPEAHEA